MALAPSLSTGGMPRPHAGTVGTSVSSLLKTKMPSLKSMGGTKGVSLKGVAMPKPMSAKGGMPKLSSKTLGGTAVKGPKAAAMPKASSLSSTLKSIVSQAKKIPGAGMRGGSLGMGSAVGAPAAMPSPSFFGQTNPQQGAPGLGM